jgi:hypothetical protein
MIELEKKNEMKKTPEIDCVLKISRKIINCVLGISGKIYFGPQYLKITQFI